MPEHTSSDLDAQTVTPRRRLSPWGIVGLSAVGCAALVLSAAGVSGLVWYFAFAPIKRTTESRMCQSQLKQLGTALQMYMADYGDVAPPSATWSQELWPYVRRTEVFICPTRPSLPAGYAYNSKLSGQRMGKIVTPAMAPVLFDSSLGVPNAWDQLQSFTTPHFRQGNVVFADGHVQAVPTAPPATAGLAAPGKR